MTLRSRLALSILSGVVLAACGGGGSPAAPTTTAPPPTPLPTPAGNSAPVLSGTPAPAVEGERYSFVPTASDADGDALSFTLSGGPAWADFDTVTGTISGTPGARDAGEITRATLSVSDGKAGAEMTLDIEVVADALEKALRTGDARGVADADMVFDAVAATVEADRTRFDAAHAQIMELDGELDGNGLRAISWNPSHDAATLRPVFGRSHALLTSNDALKTDDEVAPEALAVLGETTARHIAFGGNPIRGAYFAPEWVGPDMTRLVENSIDWLTERDDLATEPFNVVIAHHSQNYYFPDEVSTREWLDARYAQVNYNAADACDDDALAGCLGADTDLLVISIADGEDPDAIAGTVADAMEAGTPLLYMHYDGGRNAMSDALLPLFGADYVRDNYWQQRAVTNADGRDGLGTLPAEIESIRDTLARLKADDFTLRVSDCTDADRCRSNTAFADEFAAGADAARAIVRSRDRKVGLFDSEAGDERLTRLLVVLGDVLRRGASYPMDKATTPRRDFLHSLLADKLVYASRPLAEAQADMGNFSRSEIDAQPTTRRVTLTAKPSFRATGAYALPGRNFAVTRTDESDIATTVFINTLRDGATHLFEDTGYTRPKHVATVRYPIAPGETLSLSSPQGGPIQIGFSGKDEDVSFTFEGVGEHPFWDGPEDDEAFADALASDTYDWAEVSTAAFEVHSKADKMLASIGNAKWGSASALADATERYMSNYPHILAGFKGVGIDEVPEIVGWAEGLGLPMETLDRVKHMNADQATCGYGCSGNPYDAYWNFDPLGHGDLHELGHGLEKSRFRFANWPGHAVTNPYSYYSKSRYGRETGAGLDAMDCQSLPFAGIYAKVQESRNKADPFAHLQANPMTTWNEGAAMSIQFFMGAQAEGVLNDGWHLLARLHILDRAFNSAGDSDAAWIDMRNALGFEGMSRSEARALSNDDWMAIALSHATGRDYRELLETYGLAVSETASNHIAAKSLPVMPVRFFAADRDDYCEGLDKETLPFDGTTQFPN